MKRPLVWVSLAYGSSWWSSLALWGGRFWDDWILFNVPIPDQLRHFWEMGLPWMGILYGKMQVWPPIFSLTGFFSLLVALLILFRVLDYIPNVTSQAALVGVLFASAAPLFIARFSWIQLGSILGLMFFVTGWLGLLRLQSHGPKYLLVLSSALLLISFALYPAFIVLAIAPTIHILWLGYLDTSRQQRQKARLSAAVVVAVAILWMLARLLFLEPYGTYEGYNEVVWSNTLLALAACTLVTLLIFAFTVRKIPLLNLSLPNGADSVLFGLLTLLLAIGPYVAVGSPPPYSEWQTRYELTLLPVIALVIAAGVSRLTNQEIQSGLRVFGILIFSTTVVLSNMAGIQALTDWNKQRSLIHALEQISPKVKDTLVVFVDDTIGENLFKRQYRFYEWSGILAESIDSRSSFGLGVASKGEAARAIEDHFARPDERTTFSYNFHWRDYEKNGSWTVVGISRADVSCLSLISRTDCVNAVVLESSAAK